MKNQFSTFDLKALGIPRERLKDWMNQGFVEPSIPAQGKGTKAIFSLLDVYAIAFFSELLQAGFNRKVAAEIVKDFKGRESIKGTTGENITKVLFRFETRGQGRVIKSISFGPGSWAMDISNGRSGQYDPEGALPLRPFDIPSFMGDSFDENYDEILIVNFRKIRDRVNRVFS